MRSRYVRICIIAGGYSHGRTGWVYLSTMKLGDNALGSICLSVCLRSHGWHTYYTKVLCMCLLYWSKYFLWFAPSPFSEQVLEQILISAERKICSNITIGHPWSRISKHLGSRVRELGHSDGTPPLISEYVMIDVLVFSGSRIYYITACIEITNIQWQSGRRHAERSLVAWVGVIPKERRTEKWVSSQTKVECICSICRTHRKANSGRIIPWISRLQVHSCGLGYQKKDGRGHPSVSMTPTQAIRDLFAWCSPIYSGKSLSALL